MTSEAGAVRRERAPRWVAWIAAAGAALFLLPLLGLVWRAPWARAWTELSAPEVVAALRLSLVCSLSATALSLLLEFFRR